MTPTLYLFLVAAAAVSGVVLGFVIGVTTLSNAVRSELKKRKKA